MTYTLEYHYNNGTTLVVESHHKTLRAALADAHRFLSEVVYLGNTGHCYIYEDDGPEPDAVASVTR